jgi:hypothetical protein
MNPKEWARAERRRAAEALAEVREDPRYQDGRKRHSKPRARPSEGPPPSRPAADRAPEGGRQSATVAEFADADVGMPSLPGTDGMGEPE